MSDLLPLLFIPGLLCDAALWQNQINHLKDIAYCHVADTTGHDNMPALARAALAKAPARFALAGLSMGGYVSLEIMRQAPERVTKLALLDTSARADTPEQQERRRLLLAMSRSGQFRGVTPRLLPMLIHPDHMKNEILVQTVMTMAERVGREAFANQQTAILNRIDSRPHLAAIACPTLVVGGRQDILTPPDVMQEIADGVTGARFELIDKSGHLTPLEQPHTVNRLLTEWLKS